MYNLSEICLLCLNSKNLESVLVLEDNGIAVQEQLTYLLPEITISKSEIPEFICSSCWATVHSFYKFRKISLENYNRLLQYTQVLKGSGDLRGQEYSELQIQLNNVDLMMERDQDVDSEINFKEEIEGSLQSFEEYDHKTVVDDNVDIKEEFVPNSKDHEFYLKHVKDGSTADIELGSVLRNSCEEDNKLHMDEANFSADTGNGNETCNNTDTNGEELTRKDHKCSICNKVFDQKRSLGQHSRIHARMANFECSICNRKFLRQRNLITHMKLHRARVLKCYICDKQFRQKWNLKVHLKCHAGIRDFKCSVCDKIFVLKSNLTKHMKIHSGTRDQKCSVCDKMFLRKVNLTQHMKIHSGTRDHKCSVCNKKFVLKSHLSRHTKIHDKVRN